MAASSACWPNWAPSTSGQSKYDFLPVLTGEGGRGAVSCCPATVTLCCVRQVPEGPGVVGDRRPLPAEALPGSPVPPGDGSRNALDRPQPYCVLSQQSKRASFSF